MEMKYNTIFMYDTYMHMCNYDIRDNVEFFIFLLAFRKRSVWKIGTLFGTLPRQIEKLTRLLERWHLKMRRWHAFGTVTHMHVGT